MSKVRNFAELAPNIGFSEFDFYDLYRSTFEKSELGRMKKLLPLHAMAENFGLVSKSLRPKLGRKSYFTPEGKVALMFLKMYTGLSCPKLMEQLNGNIHYQMFVSIRLRTTCIFDSKLEATCSSWPKLGQVDPSWSVLPTCLAGVPGGLRDCSRSQVSGAGYPPFIHMD